MSWVPFGWYHQPSDVHSGHSEVSVSRNTPLCTKHICCLLLDSLYCLSTSVSHTVSLLRTAPHLPTSCSFPSLSTSSCHGVQGNCRFGTLWCPSDSTAFLSPVMNHGALGSLLPLLLTRNESNYFVFSDLKAIFFCGKVFLRFPEQLVGFNVKHSH